MPLPVSEYYTIYAAAVSISPGSCLPEKGPRLFSRTHPPYQPGTSALSVEGRSFPESRIKYLLPDPQRLGRDLKKLVRIDKVHGLLERKNPGRRQREERVFVRCFVLQTLISISSGFAPSPTTMPA